MMLQNKSNTTLIVGKLRVYPDAVIDDSGLDTTEMAASNRFKELGMLVDAGSSVATQKMNKVTPVAAEPTAKEEKAEKEEAKAEEATASTKKAATKKA